MDDSQKNIESYTSLFDSIPIESNPVFTLDDNDLVVLYVTEISDFEIFKKKIVEVLVSTSWINDMLVDLDMEIALDNAARTIDNVISKLEKSIAENKITSDFKQYAISVCSLATLKQNVNCQILPLSEILKEKVSNNPGFDFYVIEASKLCVFGEAKYRSNGNAHTDAINQVEDFVNDRKHRTDCEYIKQFSGESARKCIREHDFALAIGFSGHNMDAASAKQTISRRHKKSDSIKNHKLYGILIRHDGLF